jgi:hypothetical protein
MNKNDKNKKVVKEAQRNTSNPLENQRQYNNVLSLASSDRLGDTPNYKPVAPPSSFAPKLPQTPYGLNPLFNESVGSGNVMVVLRLFTVLETKRIEPSASPQFTPPE